MNKGKGKGGKGRGKGGNTQQLASALLEEVEAMPENEQRLSLATREGREARLEQAEPSRNQG